MTITLSIAIPTYNGACYIREALDSIISQLEDINEEVEIVISDKRFQSVFDRMGFSQ